MCVLNLYTVKCPFFIRVYVCMLHTCSEVSIGVFMKYGFSIRKFT